MQWTHVWKAARAAIFVALGLSVAAVAQGPIYAPGTPGYQPPAGGYKASTGLLIGAAAAAGVVGFLLLRRGDSISGCVASSGAGQTLTTADHKSVTLSGDTGDLRPGERVKLEGKASHSKDGSEGFEVRKPAHDLGACA